MHPQSVLSNTSLRLIQADSIKFTYTRRILGYVIEVYKILTNRYDIEVNLQLQLQQSNVTIIHNLILELANTRYQYDLQKYYHFIITVRVVNIWNSVRYRGFQTFRSQDVSFPGTKRLYMDDSFFGRFFFGRFLLASVCLIIEIHHLQVEIH